MNRVRSVHAKRPQRLCFCLLGGALLASAAANATTGIVAPAEDANPWQQFLSRFQETYFVANPAFAVGEGRHEFDGMLPDWSAAGIARQIAWLQAKRRQAAAFKGGTLKDGESFERDYLLSRIDTDLFWTEEAGLPFRNPAYYLDGGLDPSVYLARPYAAVDVRMKAFIAYLRAIPGATAQIRSNLRLPLPRTFIDLGVSGFGGYASFYREDAPKAFAKVSDAALQAELKAAIEPAAQAMQGLADWLKSGQSKTSGEFALGNRRFADMLWKTERVGTPLAQLEVIARADLARNLAALKDACARFLPGGSLHACIDKVNADKPKGGAVEGARAQLDELRQFVIDNKLATVPGTEKALVDEAPPYQRSNFAYIDIAGPYDKGMPSTYYIAPPDPAWPQAERDAYTPGANVLLFTSAHEVWPGHFLQFLHSNRSSFTFGQLFVGYAFAEGWAHYSEEMMWEAGLGKGAPGIHVGQLSEALLRNVRFLCAIGLHTQNMTVETCEGLFRDQGFQDPANARQQAARGTYDPAYLNYTMGKLMIRKLRADWTARHGGREGWQAFHDQFLSYGGPPIPLVRAQMLGDSDDGKLF